MCSWRSMSNISNTATFHKGRSVSLLIPQIYKGDPRSCIPPRIMALSAMGLKFGVFGFLSTTYAETNANKMCLRSSRGVWRFMRVYLHALTAVHTHLTNHGYFDGGKNLNTPNLSPRCRDKNGAGSGISPAYNICG